MDNSVQDRGKAGAVSFLSKHKKNWDKNGDPQSAVTLVSEDADKVLGLKYDEKLIDAAKTGVVDILVKANAALYDEQYIRAALLAARGARAAIRLNMRESYGTKLISIGRKAYESGINQGSSKEITSDCFWDCECDERYIHLKSEPMCPVCGAKADESPDSRFDEIAEGTHFYNKIAAMA